MADLHKDIERAEEEVRIAKARLKLLKGCQKAIDSAVERFEAVKVADKAPTQIEDLYEIKGVHFEFGLKDELKELPKDLFKGDEPDEIPFELPVCERSQTIKLELKQGYYVVFDSMNWNRSEGRTIEGRYIKEKSNLV